MFSLVKCNECGEQYEVRGNDRLIGYMDVGISGITRTRIATLYSPTGEYVGCADKEKIAYELLFNRLPVEQRKEILTA